MDFVINHSEEKRKLFVIIEEEEAYLKYRRKGPKSLEFYRTFVPKEHRKQGIGTALVLKGLEFTENNDLLVIPTCPFVAAVISQKDKILAEAK